MVKRKQQPVERRYSVEYVQKNYPPGTRVKYNAPVGLPPPEVRKRYPGESLKLLKPWRKYTDALVINPPYLDLIETKIWDPPRAFSDMMEYRELIPETPELNEFKDLTLRLFIVIPYSRPHWERMAQKMEINLVIWRPDWVVPFLQKRGLI